MKLNPKQLAASAALLGVLACAAALPASAAGPVTTPLALTLPQGSIPWDKVTAESIETGSYDAAPLAVAPIPRTGNYTICAPDGAPATLKRGIDFGMIRKKNGDAMTKNPTLFKSGAEKVAVAYGLCQRYTLESKLEDIEHGFFYFLVRCDLIKINDGKEYIITSAYGSGNTREGRTGSQSPYDGANSAIKMAQKRALVSAALSLLSLIHI